MANRIPTKFFNFRRAGSPRWYLRVLWLRLMRWDEPEPLGSCKPLRGPWLSVRLQRHNRGRALHFDIGPLEGFIGP